MKKIALARWIAVIVLGILCVYVYRPRSQHSQIEVRGFESFALAESLAQHHGFSDPFQTLPTGPSAHLPPLYPAYLALVMMAFGSGAAGASVIIWTAALLLALQFMMFPLLARHLDLGFWTGVLAALAWIAAGIPPSYLWESNLAAVLVIAIAWEMKSSFSGKLSTRQILISDVAWGVLLLLQPVAILVFAFWLLLLHFYSQTSRRQKIALGLLPVAIVAPWIVRNFVVFHRPVFIRDNLGLELAVSNNNCAAPLFEANDRSGCFAATHPNENYQEALRVQQLGEVEYNQVKLQEAVKWIVDNPGAFLVLTAQRFAAFWFPPRSENKSNGIIWRPFMVQLFTLLTLPALFSMWRNSRSSVYVVLLWLIFFPPIYYLVQFMDRYRYPIFWVTFLSGSYFIAELVRGLGGVRARDAEGELDPLASEKA
jgi:hypothetical protein